MTNKLKKGLFLTTSAKEKEENAFVFFAVLIWKEGIFGDAPRREPNRPEAAIILSREIRSQTIGKAVIDPGEKRKHLLTDVWKLGMIYFPNLPTFLEGVIRVSRTLLCFDELSLLRKTSLTSKERRYMNPGNSY